MIVQRFVDWLGQSRSTERAGAARILSVGFAQGRYPDDDPELAELSLMALAEDISPAVRIELAQSIAGVSDVPRGLVLTLAGDVDRVAVPVVARSPVLVPADLVTLASSGREAIEIAVASRRGLPARVSAVLAERAGEAACLKLLRNETAAILASGLALIGERHMHCAAIRDALARRRDCPPALRHQLVGAIARSLSDESFVTAVLGARRTERVLQEAGEKATAIVADAVPPAGRAEFLAYLRRAGRLNLAFLLRAVAGGHIDLFVDSLVELSGYAPRRVRAIVVDGRATAFRALVSASGIPVEVAPLLRQAVVTWREVLARTPHAAPEDVAPLVMERLAASFARSQDSDGFADLLQRVHQLAGEAVVEAARDRVRRLAA
ncbi:DUF2336 domain-containing protein [Aurantimonas sp. Leaf443]|uniref:DUF2336 domain-containing protein n=1 Tax=Aurantimonas sp. Leaf443 TaxID=1736378 RepID=UPI0006FD32BC|nr:DUF2336 domain-containing protein [Aurantimonas sp. Leaf443]KQT82728.1 hypothetical protein ASG48_14600 [Aurantimonas sp. Leaf443]